MFGRIAGGLGMAGTSATRSGSPWVGSGLGAAGRYFGRLGAMNPQTIGATAGAAMGGMYGAFSDNTSVLGGAIGGGLMGMGGGLAANRYVGSYLGRRMGLTRGGRATGLGLLRSDVMGVPSLVSNGAVNGFKALQKGFAG